MIARLLIILVSFSFAAKAQEFPPRPSTIVTDYTNTLSGGEQQALEQKLVAFNDSTSSQVAIVIMHSVGSNDISEYAVQLYNNWGIGQKEKNNGVLILVAKEDRNVFITTGYGMEGVLPDALCKRVVNNDILPNFKAGNYYGGLDAAVNTIMSIVKGEYTADQYMKKKKEKVPWFGAVLVLLIFFIVIISKIGSTKNYARRNNLGFWAAWALMNAAMSRGRSGGSWGGFSSGSGGFGGGGFGGFGGGSSGGGGAGGSW
ncbi:hypothetical protein BH11BAC1_BH11BAC1_17030 [soil metagenome]